MHKVRLRKGGHGLTSKRSLKDRAYEEIKTLIDEGELKPNEMLREMDLAERFGMSRTPVREAFQMLEEEGLIQIIRNKGAIVTKLDLNDIIEISQAREAIEGMAARLACGRIKPARLEELEKKLNNEKALRANGIISVKEFHSCIVQYGMDLHNEILRCSDNKIIIKTAQTLNFQFKRVMSMARMIGRREKALDEHLEIIKALKIGDPDLAEKKMREHIKMVQNDLIDSYRIK